MIMRRLICALFFTFCSIFYQGVDSIAFVDLKRPPIGAKYEKAIGLPVLGKQEFSLHILSDNTAHLLVKGMLFLDEIVAYTMVSGGCLQCRLSDKALKQLRTFRTTLKEVGYDCHTDTPYVKVSTPLPLPVKIHLQRKDGFGDIDGMNPQVERLEKNDLITPQ